MGRLSSRWWKAFVCLAIFAVGMALGLALVRGGAFSRDFTATVECANGGAVVGAFVEAERFPRVPLTGWEVNSGFAPVMRSNGVAENRAEVRFRLPLGGRASVHFGCQLLDGTNNQWGTDNRTPFFDGSHADWACRGVLNTAPPTRVVTNCYRTS